MPSDEVDPQDNPDYFSLAAAAKECGVRVQVLQQLVRSNVLVDGVVRSRRGQVYLHVERAPSWAQVELMVRKLYTDQLAAVDRRVRAIETEVEAIRFDVNEARENLDGPIGDDLLSASILHSYDRENSKTLPGAVAKLQSDVLTLQALKDHLTEVRATY